jgi:hypothetical protein
MYIIQRRRRYRLVSSTFVLVYLLLITLACATTPLLDPPLFVCPTPLPPANGYNIPAVPPTPYVIRPPQDFYRGDAVFVGDHGDTRRVRFRLQNVYVLSTTSAASRSLYVWSLEIRNLGIATYEVLPVAHMVLSRIRTSTGEIEGTWRANDTAMREADITGENYEPLPPNTTRIYRMAAYAPLGSPRRFTFMLDEESGNTITWMNETNPYCSGDVADE